MKSAWARAMSRSTAFDARLIADLTAALPRTRRFSDDAAPAVRRGGAGCARSKSFCAAADLDWMKAAAASVEENLEDARKLAAMLRALAEPVQTHHRPRARGGAMAAAWGWWRPVISPSPRRRRVFAHSEVRLGILPATIGPYVVRAIGARQAQRYFLTAERISTPPAQDIGLLHEVVVDADALDAQIAELAVRQTLAGQGGPKALAASKALIRAVASRPIGDGLGRRDRPPYRRAARNGGGAGRACRLFGKTRRPGWQTLPAKG